MQVSCLPLKKNTTKPISLYFSRQLPCFEPSILNHCTKSNGKKNTHNPQFQLENPHPPKKSKRTILLVATEKQKCSFVLRINKKKRSCGEGSRRAFPAPHSRGEATPKDCKAENRVSLVKNACSSLSCWFLRVTSNISYCPQERKKKRKETKEKNKKVEKPFSVLLLAGEATTSLFQIFPSFSKIISYRSTVSHGGVCVCVCKSYSQMFQKSFIEKCHCLVANIIKLSTSRFQHPCFLM